MKLLSTPTPPCLGNIRSRTKLIPRSLESSFSHLTTAQFAECSKPLRGPTPLGFLLSRSLKLPVILSLLDQGSLLSQKVSHTVLRFRDSPPDSRVCRTAGGYRQSKKCKPYESQAHILQAERGALGPSKLTNQLIFRTQEQDEYGRINKSFASRPLIILRGQTSQERIRLLS